MMSTTMNDFPRRSQLDQCTPAELAIYAAMDEVEKVGSDSRLTDAITKLFEARNLVADFVDKIVDRKNLPFGEAIEALKQGKRVQREGWNGKGMFLFLLPAGIVPTKAIHDPTLREVIEQEIGGETFEALGSIRMFTADKKILTGWLASQTDMLAEDWIILD